MECHNTKCIKHDDTCPDNCERFGTHDIAKCKLVMLAPQDAPEAVSDEFAGYGPPPIQAIKDAMWHVDTNLQGMDMNLIQKARTEKCLRELHDYLDRIGA